MTTKAQRNLVDSQWNEQAIVWGQEAHGRERSLIYPMLEGGETIQGLVGCAWGPARVFSEDSSWIVRKAQLRGVAVATDVQVLLLAKKGVNRCVTRLPFDSITAVECDGAVVTITGDGIHNWQGPGQDDPFQVREVNGVNADRFARLVDELRTSPPSADTSPTSVANYAGMSKAERINAQWQDLAPDEGGQGLLAGLLGGLMGKSSANPNSAERRKLDEILEDDENIEYWLAGRWGKPNDFGSISGALGRSMAGPGGGNKTGHAGVAVTTDRRLLFISGGNFGGRVVELPYEHIDTVDYNDGMVASGVKFFGNNIDPYEFYHDHENKPAVKGRARRLAQSVRQHLDTLSDEAAAGEIE